MFERIEQLKAKIDQLRPIDSDLKIVLQQKLRIDWTYNSNAIEGNTLTLGETAFFLQEGLTSEGRPLKDYLEAKNHAEAIDALQDIVEGKRDITESLIKELNSLLLRDTRFTYTKGANGHLIKKPLRAGQYKTRPNHVLTLSGKIHHYINPIHVKQEMEQLVLWLSESSAVHVVERAALFHYRFVKIHPFDDGNGRLARLLMNLILMREGYPICIIKNQHRRTYLEAIEVADETQETKPFVEFIASELEESLQTILDTLTGKSETISQNFSGPNERQKAILSVFESNPLSISQISKKLPRINYNTLKKDLKNLVESGRLKKKGEKKGLVYFREYNFLLK